MAFSFEVYPGLTGVVTDFAVPFGFINRSHVTADVDGVSAPFTWLSDSMIRMTTAPTGNLTIARNTPKTTQVVAFTDGSTQSAELHNLQNQQLLYVTQEAYDTVVNVLGGDGVIWDALGRQIKNVSAPTDPTDAVNKTWAETSMTSTLAQAITARVAAELAETNAETAQSGSVAARVAAEFAQAASEAARDAAVTAKNASEAARDAAQDHVTSASGSATTATTKAGEAASSATTAATSATDAAGSASTATTQAGIATTKASEASTSAAAAAASAAEAAGYVPTVATQAEAEAGTDNTKLMTPLRTREAVAKVVKGDPTAPKILDPALDTGAATAAGTAWVGLRTAGLATGAVGSYALLQSIVTTSAAAGSTHAGSSLRYSNAAGTANASSGTPAGTWRLMGRTVDQSGAGSTSLFLRIS